MDLCAMPDSNEDIAAIARRRAEIDPDGVAFTFLHDGEAEAGRLTWSGLDLRARAIAAALQGPCAPGDNVLLLFPPGLDFVAAFLGCLYAGLVAVPAYPPRSPRALPRLRSILGDCRPALALTSAASLPRLRAWFETDPGIAPVPWLAADEVPEAGAADWRDPGVGPDALAFLQYTSGSTSTPKGVMVSRGNLSHNQWLIQEACGHSADSVFVSWLPVYHDLGLIGQVLQAIWVGASCVLMAPVAFLQRPMRWLEAVSRYRATTSGAPNFAWELCARKGAEGGLPDLDLSSWRVAFNGAEPVRAETLARFAEVFAPCGFDADAAYPCYGLAEATLMVSGGRPGATPVVAAFDGRPLVGCGRPLGDLTVAIADPATGEPLPDGREGEIWVAGRSVARGYWGKPEESAEAFGARLAGVRSGEGPFLRTGDLGLLSGGELFVTGRIKDLIILRGRNLYPQDVEQTAGDSHPALRAAGAAAFAVDAGGEERLVVVHEVDRRVRRRAGELAEIAAALRAAVAAAHEAPVWDVVLVEPGGVPRTTSGKVQRRACRALYLEGSLPVVGRSTLEAREEEAASALPALAAGGLREALAATPEGERPALAEAWLRATFGRLARIDAARLDAGEPLAAHGLDSLVAIELRNAVETELGADLGIAPLLEGMTLREAAARALAGTVAAVEEGAEAAPDAGTEGEPLSWNQRSLWFLYRLAPEAAAYHIAGAARLPEGADVAALGRALQALVDRHPALRTVYRDGTAGPVQVVLERQEVAFRVEDATGWSADELLARVREETLRPFDLEQGPVFRAACWTALGGEAWLALSVHHVAADFWSLALMARELGSLYGAAAPSGASLLAPAATYAGFARWQERRLAGERGRRLEEHWRERLAGVPPLDLATDRPRPPAQGWRGGAVHLRLGAERLAALQALAAREGCTLFMALLAAFQALLGRHAGQDDFAVGSPVSGRGAERWQGVVGYFVNPVALRADLAGDPTGTELLARTRRTALAAFEHQELPFALLAERLQPERDAGRHPVFQAMLALQKAPEPGLEALAAFALDEAGARLPLGSLTLESLPLESGASQLDLSLMAAELDGALGLALRYDSDLFDGATAERLLARFAVLLVSLAAEPARRLSELELLAEGERGQVLAWGSGEALEVPDGPVHRRAAAWARREPGRLAVVDAGGRETTYGRLVSQAATLAVRLRSLGIGAEVRVAVLASRSADLVAGQLAVLTAGGAYVPLDPAYPVDRLAWMLADSGAAAVLAQEGLRGKLPVDLGVPVLALDGEGGPAAAPEVEIDAAHPAYVIYTSGSTGRPKGVEVTHGGLANLAAWHQAAYGLTPDDRASLLAATGFDASVWEVWPTLAAGASLHVPDDGTRAEPRRLAAWLAERGITVSFLPTPLAEAVLDAPWPAGTALRALLTGGDTLHRRPPAGLPFRLFNHYGPTESSVVATRAEVPPDGGSPAGPPPIGRPVPNLRALLLGRAGELVPPGAPGELCLGGAGLARGYLGRPDLTAERFVPDPSGPAGARLYRTGDLARFRPDGGLEFLGRLDAQVKVRGVRVELGEIEAALAAHPRVREAAVGVEDGAAGRRLVAGVVGEGEPPTSSELRAFLRRTLPEAMVPAVFVPLSSLPLTPNGKVDRRAVAAAAGAVAPDGEPAAALRTPTEEVVAAVWADLLGAAPGPRDSFFESGGHSLLAARLTARLREALGVELPLAALFADPTVAGLAAAADAALGAAAEAPPLVPAPRGAERALSFAQERLWFLERLAPGLPVYNIPVGLRLRGPLRPERLAAALAGIAARHEVLRTRFSERQGRAVLEVLPPPAPALFLVDLAGLAEAARETEGDRLAGEEARRPFDLAAEVPWRAVLLRFGEGDHLLLLTLHHIAADGGSIGVLLRELEALYGGERLPGLPVQYADWAAWQRGWLAGEALEARLDWWRGQLAGAPAALDLPTDRPRPAVQSHRGAAVPALLDGGLAASLRALARREGATLFMTVLAGLAAVLERWSGQSDLVVGSAAVHRDRPETEPLIGLFVETLPLQVRLEGAAGFSSLLAAVRATSLGAYAHHDVPFERLVDELAPRRDLSRSPLFQVMLVLRDAPPERLRLPGTPEVAAEPLPPHRHHTGTAKFDLTLSLAGDGAGLAGALEADAALFDPATALRLLGHLEVLLGAAAADPRAPLAALPLLTAAERRQLAEEWNAATADYDRGAGLHELFRAQASRTPEATALLWRGERISYGELDRRAAVLAGRLRALGVGPEVRVGVLAERTPDLVAALLAVMTAGGAYVPIDPRYPAERIAYLLADSAAPVLLVGEGLEPLASGYPGRVVPLAAEVFSGPVAVLPRGFVHPDQLAYVIYTSGSTGRPKGVGIRHASAVSRVAWARETFAPERLERVLAATSVCFDLSVFEIFVPLALGGAVVLVDDALALADLPADAGVTLVNTVPSAMAELVRAGGVPASVRTVNLAGEPLRRELADAVLALPGVEELWNLYGPSEDTTYSTGARIPADGRPPAIGRPLANSRVRLLDGELRPVPAGVPGEVWMAGDGVARGYLGRPELTADRFRPDPGEGAGPGARAYRTGDLARWRTDGELEYLGRLDHQVKIRGFRIEPGEVEAVLAEHPALVEVAVAALPAAEGPRLAAWVAPAAGSVVAPGELRAWLASRLPSHMVPQAWAVLDRLPRTPNGKLDRAALPAPESGVAGGPARAAAALSPLQELVAGIWAGLLDRPEIGLDDDFFALGGHSLLAVRAASRLRELLGVELPLRALFEAPTVAGLAARVEAAMSEGAGGAGRPVAPPLVRAPRGPAEPPPPLSFSQQRLWFLDQLVPGSPLYNVPVAARLRGALDPAALAAALGEVVRRHEVLRTTFGAEEGRPYPRVVPPAGLPLPLVDLSALPEAAREPEAGRLAVEEGRRPFDLARGPLVRGALLRLATEEHALHLSLHHIVSDGWSAGVLIREVAALYGAAADGAPSPLPELAVQYSDFAAWQRRLVQGDVLDGQLRYWRERLADPPALDLPTDRPRPPAASFRGGVRHLEFPAGAAASLRALARRRGATLFMALLATWKTLLHRYTGQVDLLVGTPIANRGRAEVEGLIGFFVNTLALRTALGGDPTAGELIERVREVALGAYAHQDLPFEKLVEELHPERDLSRNPLFQVDFVLQSFTLPPIRLSGLTLEVMEVDSGTSKFDLSLFLLEDERGLRATLQHSSDLFDGTTAARVLEHFRALAEGAAADPGRRLSELALLTAGERHQLVAEWAAVEPVASPSFPRLFAGQASRTPDAVAVAFGDRVLTYGELAGRAAALGRRLRALGCGPETVVGLCCERSPELLVGLLGVLAAGAAYLPLAPEYPRERLAFVLDDARPAALVATPAALSLLPERGLPTVLLDTAEPEAGGGWDDMAEPLDGSQLAYVLYTSGSTGRPKGVMVHHRGLANYLAWAARAYPVGQGKGAPVHSPVGFDLTVTSLLLPLVAGRAAVLLPEEAGLDGLVAALTEGGFGLVKLTPAHLEILPDLLPPEAAATAARALVVGGDALHGRALRFWRSAGADVRLFNEYGPTETVVGCCVHEVPPGVPGPGPVPIGTAIAGMRMHLLDRFFRSVPVGVPGEIFIGGANVGRGYLRRPGLTAERFVPDPYAASPGERLYRTGDLARHRPDGTIEFLGRLDDQVKVRGFRIELGEVESVLAAQEGVRDAVVLARDAGRSGLELAAFVAGEGGVHLDADTLRDALTRELPAYMVPPVLLVLDALPLTANGKVDREALSRLAAVRPAAAAESSAAAPASPTEEVLAGIWADVLGRERVGTHDDFFALGGHSLLATQAVSRVRRAFGVDLPLRTLFERPTVARLAEAVEAARRAEGLGELPVERVGRDRPLPLSFPQQRLWYLDQLHPGRADYNLAAPVRLSGLLDERAFLAALLEVARRHEVLRTTFPVQGDGPVQAISPEPALRPLVVDLTALPAALAEAEQRRLAWEETQTPFDLARGPLVRAALLRLAPEEHALLLTMHHIVGDAWSLGVMVEELAALYGSLLAGRPSPLAELPVQYADFAVWQRRWLESEACARDLDYWRSRLAGAPHEALPTDFPRVPGRAVQPAREPAALPADLSARLAALAREVGLTPYLTLLAGFAAAVGLHGRQEEVVIGSNVANRNRLETEGLVGFFVNLLVLRVDLSGDPSFHELLRRVRAVALEAYVHQDLPFDRLVQELAAAGRDPDRTPLFQVKLDLAPGIALEDRFPGLRLAPIDAGKVTARYDLHLEMAETPAGFAGWLNYDAGLFGAPTASRLTWTFERVLHEAAADPGLRLGELRRRLAEGERERRRQDREEREAARLAQLQRMRRRPTAGAGGRATS